MWGGAPTRSPSSPPLPSSGVAGYTGWAVARSVRLGLASSTTCAASCGVGGLGGGWDVCWCPSAAHGATCVLQSKGLPIKALPISLTFLAGIDVALEPVAEWLWRRSQFSGGRRFDSCLVAFGRPFLFAFLFAFLSAFLLVFPFASLLLLSNFSISRALLGLAFGRLLPHRRRPRPGRCISAATWRTVLPCWSPLAVAVRPWVACRLVTIWWCSAPGVIR